MKSSFRYRKYFLIIISILFVYSIIVLYSFNSIRNKDEDLRISRLSQDCTIASKQVSDYFGPIQNLINHFIDLLHYCEFDINNIDTIPNQFFYIIDNYSQFSSITVASETGKSFSLARLSRDTLVTIKIYGTKALNEVSIQKFCRSNSIGHQFVSENNVTSDFNILGKPWVKGALESDRIFCTETYEFYYSKEPGITFSKRFTQISNPEIFLVVGFDVMIKDILSSVKVVNPDFEDDIFLLNSHLEIISSPNSISSFDESGSSKKNQRYDRTKLIKQALEETHAFDKPIKPFEFSAFGKHWFTGFEKIRTSEDSSFYLGIIHPDSFFQQTGKKVLVILISSLLFVLLLSIYLVYSFSEQHKKNQLLITKNFALAKSNNPFFKYRNENILDQNNADQTIEKEVPDFSSRTTIRIIDELELLINNKFFLNPDINLYKLSKELDTNTTYLSKVINEYLGKNFSEFLKELRINEAILRIENDKMMIKYSIDGFSRELGFRSKSSFNVAFKKYTGMTPSEFIGSLP